MRRSRGPRDEGGVLVLPDGTIRHCRARSDFKTFVEERRIDGKLAGNLRQLLGFEKVGADRDVRFEAGGTGNKYRNLEDAVWWHHAQVATAVPLFGSGPEIDAACPPAAPASSLHVACHLRATAPWIGA